MKAERLVAIVLVALTAAAVAGPEAPTTASPPVEAPGTGPKTAGTAAKGDVSADAGYLSYAEPGPPEPPGLLSLAGRVVGSLALVVGLIFVAALVLRRYLGGATAPTTSRKVSELVEVTPLGGKRYLYVIREGAISQDQALDGATEALRGFMLKQHPMTTSRCSRRGGPRGRRPEPESGAFGVCGVGVWDLFVIWNLRVGAFCAALPPQGVA